ncbi:Leukotriene A-4 hydrolase [Chamberlinius hualienensis]
MMEYNESSDLPLLANVDDVMVDHYILVLKCDFSNKRFVDCDVYVYLTPVDERRPFLLILDSKDIVVNSVKEIEACESLSTVSFNSDIVQKLSQCKSIDLEYNVEPWCVRIWKASEHGQTWPRVVRISYTTSAAGQSVSWCKDQNAKDCCYTFGACINNRSLFPCQEPPSAMATWQAFVTSELNATVVVSGDEEPITVEKNDVEQTFYSYTAKNLPMATFALAVGFWRCYSLQLKSILPLKSCLYSAADLLTNEQRAAFSARLIQVIDKAQTILGVYPFSRIDFLILPRNYDSLGLASPNVVFLSQSAALDTDGLMLGIRLAHEVAHGWFGLLIGAKDWTEEWLSEGFATYMEDIILIRTVNWNEKFIKDWRELRTYLRYENLMNELKELEDEDLQSLRPNKGEVSTKSAKNGLVPEKTFMQVHYVKGYFLLNYLSQLVGENEFLKILKSYTEVFSGKLVSSQELLIFFLNRVNNLSSYNVSVNSVCERWLDCPGIPPDLRDFYPSKENCLFNEVLAQFKWWRHVNSVKGRKKFKNISITTTKLCCEQKVLLLDMLLKENHLSKTTLGQLRSFYKLDESNAEGMGVYLYGELMISEKCNLQKLANDCWEKVNSVALYSAANVVNEILRINETVR